MSHLTLVLWLRNGRKLAEVTVADRGGVPWDYRHVVFDEVARGNRLAVLDGPCEPVRPQTRELVFKLTEEGDLAFDRGESWSPAAQLMYNLGRRRFHYLCTTEWAPTLVETCSMMMPPHVRERIEREQRIWQATKQQMALLEAGAFPGEKPQQSVYGKSVLEFIVECNEKHGSSKPRRDD